MNQSNDNYPAWEDSEKPEIMLRINMDDWSLLLSYACLEEATWSKESTLKEGFLQLEFTFCSIKIVGTKLEELLSHIQNHQISRINLVSPIKGITATKKVG
jgi:hypothetical protein